MNCITSNATSAPIHSSRSSDPLDQRSATDHQPTVLVVEDERLVRKNLLAILQRSGYAVLEAATGEEGLDLFQKARPGAAILDIMLPGMDGFEVCRRLRAMDPRMAILILTAKAQDMDKIRGLEIGADDYMVKPYNPDELVARIRAILRRGGHTADLRDRDQPIGFRIDPHALKCLKNDHAIDLTPKEAALLGVLLGNPGRALSRSELRSSVWGQEHHGSDKALDVYVRKLREKLEDDPSNPKHLKTVWGVGYTWRAEPGGPGSENLEARIWEGKQALANATEKLTNLRQPLPFFSQDLIKN